MNMCFVSWYSARVCSNCSCVSEQLEEERQVEKDLSQGFRNVTAHSDWSLHGHMCNPLEIVA